MKQDSNNESVVIYYSWFKCIRAFGPKSFFPAFDALFSYAFEGKPIEQNELPELVVTVLETFTPVIDKNRKNRENGKKGAPFGCQGGRPPKNTPAGLVGENPDGVSPQNPTVTVTDTETENKKDTVSVTAEGSSPHTDFDFFFPVFFFRNLLEPRNECQRFIDHYSASEWTLQGGSRLDTDEKRLAKARSWNPKNSDRRFSERFLSSWKQLYDLAPEDVRQSMLKDKVEGKMNGQTYEIYCEQIFYDWMMKPELQEKKKEILDRWKGDGKLIYKRII